MRSNNTLEKWEEKTINDVCIVERGSSPRPIKNFVTSDNSGVNWIKIGDCSGKYVTNTAQKITIEGAKKSRAVKVGDFIISNSMSYGKPYILKIDGFIHDGWFVLRLNKNLVNADYFYYLLSSNYIREQYDALATGAIVQNISSDLIKKVKFKLPPLPEQERIVAKLDKAFEAIDKVKANAEQNLTNAKELFESTLYSLCNDKKANWTTGRLDNYFVLQRGFDLPKQDRKKGQYPLVSSNGITDFIDTYKIKRPVVVTGRSGTIGSVHYVDENSWPLNTTLYVKDFKDNVPKYIFYYLKSLNLAEYSSGAGVPTLNRNYIHEIIISFPLQSEQQKIVEKLDVLQEQTKQLEQIYTQKIKECDELKQSILQKAFRGEL